MWRKREKSPDTYREAAEAYLGGPKVEAAAVLRREHAEDSDLLSFGQRIHEVMTRGRAGSLPYSFLLAVTNEKVYALKYRTTRNEVEVRKQIEVFDRDEIRLRADESGSLTLEASDENGTQSFHLRDKLDETPGAAEMISALSE